MSAELLDKPVVAAVKYDPKVVQELMARLYRTLGQADRWEPVKYGRWRDATGASPLEVETNYVYGEGTVRLYDGRAEVPYHTMRVRGHADEAWKLETHLGPLTD